jgi:hypothetical protein
MLRGKGECSGFHVGGSPFFSYMYSKRKNNFMGAEPREEVLEQQKERKKTKKFLFQIQKSVSTLQKGGGSVCVWTNGLQPDIHTQIAGGDVEWNTHPL